MCRHAVACHTARPLLRCNDARTLSIKCSSRPLECFHDLGSNTLPLLTETNVQVWLDNEKDSENTVLTVEGKDQPHLLMTLSGALTTAGYMVASAVSSYLLCLRTPAGGALVTRRRCCVA